MHGPLQNNAVGELAARRLKEMSTFTGELVEEAYRVARGTAELASLERLVDQVDGAGAWARRRRTQRPQGSAGPRGTTRRSASRQKVWRRLLPQFDVIEDDTRAMLVRAERRYSNSVADLGRSAHLLAIVVESELKRRVFEPAQRSFTGAARNGESATWRVRQAQETRPPVDLERPC